MRRTYKGKGKSKQEPFNNLKPQEPPSKGSKVIVRSNRKTARISKRSSRK